MGQIKPIKQIRQYLEFIVLFGLVLTSGLATYQRNFVWKDDITLWSDVVKKSPQKLRGYYGLARAYEETGRYDLAIEYYKGILQQKVMSRMNSEVFSDIHNSLGLLYCKIGRVDEGIEDFKNAIQINPSHVKAHNNLGLAYLTKGLVDEGIEELKNAIKTNPYYMKAHYNLGNAYQIKGLLDEATSEYETAVRLKPDFVPALNDLGVIYFKKGEVDMAIDAFRKAIRIMPDSSEAHYNLGIAYGEKGLHGLAEAEMRKGIELRSIRSTVP